MIRNVFAVILICMGIAFMLASAIGVIRLKDFYSRVHASGVGETAGMICCGLGLIIYEGLTTTGLKLIVVVLLSFLANPAGIHILSRVSYRAGLRPWEKVKEVKKDADTDN